MERSTARPSGAIRPVDLVSLVESPGPFATVWLSLSGTGGFGAAADERRRKNVEADLAEAGAPHSVCAAVGGVLTTVDPGAAGVVVVADTSGGVKLVEELPGEPRANLTRWAPLPSLSPVIEHRQADVPVVIALADRLGADVIVKTPAEQRHVLVEGEDEPIHKSGQGGWSQQRYEQRTENTWERNAAEVSAEVAKAAQRTDAELVIVGGDVRAVELIVDHLPDEVRAATRTIAHGRATNGSEKLRDDEIQRLVRTTVAEDTVELLRAFEERSARGDTAANGPEATLTSLRNAQVDVLLVHDEPGDERTTQISVDGDEYVEARLVDAAIREALRSGASIRVVPDATALDGGIGALLRWETADL